MASKHKNTEEENILQLLFTKENEELGKKQLENTIYKQKIKMRGNNVDEYIYNLLTSFKQEIFVNSEEFRKKIEKDISPIIAIQTIIQIYSKNPYNFFILLNPLFDMFKNLDSNIIEEYTTKITELLEEGKNEIILKNFNELFEIVIYLVVNQDKSVRVVGENLNNLLKKTLEHSFVQLDNKNNFDFDAFEKKIIEKTQVNQPILDTFLLDWIDKICEIETLNIYIGKLFFDIIPWILKIKNNNMTDNLNKAIECDNKMKNKFLNKYLNFYYKEKDQINKCILSFIKLIKNKNISDVSNEYKFLYELIKQFIFIIEENENNNSNNINLNYDNSCSEYYSPRIKRRCSKSKYGDGDIIKSHGISQSIYYPKKCKIFDTIRNISKVGNLNLNSFDSLDQYSENKNIELSNLIPLDILNDFLQLIIECNDINKEEQLNKLNSELKKLIGYIPNNYDKFNSIEFINIIVKGIEKPEIINKDYLLDWFQLLCEKYEKNITDASITTIIKSILKTIQTQGQNPDKIKNRNLILLMLQKLKKLNIEKIFSLLYDSLNKINDFSFIYEIDGYINYYLITIYSSDNFRKDLIEYGKPDHKEHKGIYEKIYRILAYNPVCLLIYSTITEYYELSWYLILNFYKIKFDDSYYTHLGEFIQLIENTQSNDTRMLLLHPQHNIYLTKTLYGILMLLPQGKAYNILSNRLYSIKGLFRYYNEINDKIDEYILEDIKYFINIFIDVQKRKK